MVKIRIPSKSERNQQVKTKSTICAALYSFGLAVGVGAIMLIASSAHASLFASTGSDGNILAYTPSGTQSTFASGLSQPGGMAFDSAGNLFVTSGNGNITKITPSGVTSTFASGL